MLEPDAAPAPTFEGRPLPHPDEPVFDQGLAFDVATLSRRRVLQALGFGAIGAGMFTIMGASRAELVRLRRRRAPVRPSPPVIRAP